MKNHIVHNLLDIDQFHMTIDDSKSLKNLITLNNRMVPEFEVLAFDVFLVLYKIVLKLKDNLPINEQFILISAISTHPQSKLLRIRTVGSRWESYLAMKILLDQLVDRLRGTPILEGLRDATVPQHNRFSSTNSSPEILDRLFSASEKQLIGDLQQKTKSGGSKGELVDFVDALMTALEKNTDIQESLHESGQSKNVVPTLVDIEEQSNDKILEEFIKEAHATANTPEDTPDLQTLLDEVLQKEGNIDEEYTSKVKENFEKRFSPYLKSLMLSEGMGNETLERFESALPQDEMVDTRQIVDGKPQNKKSPVDVSFNRLTTEEERMQLLKNPDIEKQLEALNLDAMIKSTSSKLDAFENNIQTLGIPPESMDTLPFEEVIQLYNRTKDPKFINFINRVGKLKSMANKIAHHKKRARITPIDGIRHSNDIDSLIEDELIQFALDIDAFENDFYDRYLRDDLLTVEMSAEKHKRKGPIILCYDGSGSMQGVKFEETVMHILSILEVARIQKRRMVIIQFASASEPMYIKSINPLAVSSQDILDILDTFICGGTNFEKPLAHAMSIIKTSKHKNSDILFITDGQCEISKKFKDSFIKLKQERQFKLYTIIMHSYTYQDYGDIGEISDEILDIKGELSGVWSDNINEHIYSII